MKNKNFNEKMQDLNLVDEKKVKLEDELIEFNQAQDFSWKSNSEQDFFAEVQIKLSKGEFNQKNDITYDGANTFLKFSIFTCNTLSEKDWGLIIKILDETYPLFDIDKLGWCDKYTVQIKKC